MKRSPLTARQARFVEEFLIDGIGTAAAIRAGFAPRSASVRAARLVKDSQIAEAIREGQAEIRAALKIDQKAVIRALQAAYDLARARSEPAAMVASAKEIARLLGFYAPSSRQ